MWKFPTSDSIIKYIDKHRRKKMSEYQYPDKDDKLTAALINNEYDGLSWQKSEEKGTLDRHTQLQTL